MKRFAVFVLAAALLLVSACGTAATDGGSKPPPYGDASPTPPPSATAAPIVYEPVELPDHYPPLGFQVDSVWQSAPFGDRGAAVLYMGTAADGATPMKLYLYQYYEFAPGDKRVRLGDASLSAVTGDEGFRFRFDGGASDDRVIAALGEASGSMDPDGERLVISYAQPAYEGFALPVEFKRLTAAEAGKAMYAMPLYEDELLSALPATVTPEELHALFGDPEETKRRGESPELIELRCPDVSLTVEEWADESGNLNYHIWWYDTAAKEQPLIVRGIDVGDDCSKVLASFPGWSESLCDAMSRTKDGCVEAYGVDMAWVNFRCGRPTEITCQGGVNYIRFYFDDELKVERITRGDTTY